MRNLSRPNITGSEARLACVPRIRMERHHARYDKYAADLLAEEKAFRRAIDAGVLHLLKPLPFDKEVTRDLSALYKNRFKSSDEAADLRLQLERLANDECPFCLIGQPTTFEHMFPKSTYPWLAVDPLNIAHACKDCNLDRKAGSGKSSINVYVDDWIHGSNWLGAKIRNIRHPGSLRYFIRSTHVFDRRQQKLIAVHFDERHLARRYSIQAAGLFIDILDELRAYHERNGGATECVSTRAQGNLLTLVHARESRHGTNYWEVAALRAWLEHAPTLNWARLAGITA